MTNTRYFVLCLRPLSSGPVTVTHERTTRRLQVHIPRHRVCFTRLDILLFLGAVPWEGRCGVTRNRKRRRLRNRGQENSISMSRRSLLRLLGRGQLTWQQEHMQFVGGEIPETGRERERGWVPVYMLRARLGAMKIG